METIKKFEPLFGSWSVEAVIGSGEKGSVYKAYRDTESGREYCAIKHVPIPASEGVMRRLKEGGLDDESMNAYIESKLMAANRETAIAERLGGYADFLQYEQTELRERESGLGYDLFIRTPLEKSLASRMAEGPLSREEQLDLGIDIATALEACSTEGVVHRNVKPANIFCTETGFKLGDASMARLAEMGGEPEGAPSPYAAPEILKGEPASESSDVYSLGLILYRAANKGRMPLLPPDPEPYTEAMVDSAALRRVAGAKLPAPSEADELLSGVILKALACEPKDRYPSARELRQALSSIKYRESLPEETPAEEEPAETPKPVPIAVIEDESYWDGPIPSPEPEKRGRKQKRRKEKPQRSGETQPFIPAEEPLPGEPPLDIMGEEPEEFEGSGRGIKIGIIIASIIAGLALLGIVGILAKNAIEDMRYKKDENAFKPHAAEIVQDTADPDVYRVTLYRVAGTGIVYETQDGKRREYVVPDTNKLVVEVKGSELMPDEPIDSSAYSAQPRFFERAEDGTLTPADDVGFIMLEVPPLNVTLECGDTVTTEDGYVRISGQAERPETEVTVDGNPLDLGEGSTFTFEKTYENNGEYELEFEARLPRCQVWRQSVTVKVAIPEPPMIMLPWDMGDTSFSQRVTDPNDTVEVYGSFPAGMSFTVACEDESVIFTEPEVTEEGAFSFTATLPAIGDYVFTLTCADENGTEGTRELHLQRAPEWKPYVESAWAMSYDALTRASNQCYNVKGTVIAVTEHIDKYVAVLETSDGSTLLLEYHHHYPTANTIEAGKEYKFIYGHPIGRNSDGAPVVYVWFINDK